MDEGSKLATVAKALRLLANRSQRQVAQIAGCSAEWVSGWERGKSTPAAPMQLRILRATGADDEAVALAIRLVERLAHTDTEAHDGH